MKGVKEAAIKAAGLSHCDKCELFNKGGKILCSSAIMKACRDAYVKGFENGTQWSEKQLKK